MYYSKFSQVVNTYCTFSELQNAMDRCNDKIDVN